MLAPILTGLPVRSSGSTCQTTSAPLRQPATMPQLPLPLHEHERCHENSIRGNWHSAVADCIASVSRFQHEHGVCVCPQPAQGSWRRREAAGHLVIWGLDSKTLSADLNKREQMLKAHPTAAMAVTSPGSFLAFSCRRPLASHNRAVRSEEPENSSWRRLEPSGGEGANATAVTLCSAESHALKRCAHWST